MKLNWREKLVRQLCCGGLSSGVYCQIKPRLRQHNLLVLRRSSFLAFVMGLVLCLVSFSVPSIKGNSTLYVALMVVSGISYTLCRTLFPRHPGLVLPAWYLFLSLSFGFGVVLGSIRSPMDAPAVTFCVLLFALPLLVVDVAWRMDLLIIATTVIFCILAHQTKSPGVFSLDLVNSVSFCLLSLFVNSNTSCLSMRDVANRMFIEKERDTDGMTRLLTKSATQLLIQSHLGQSQGGALLILDVDNFKKINDAIGHAYGDEVLLKISQILNNSFRRNDVVGRFGGDEFLIYMLGADYDAACHKAEDLLAALKETFSGDSFPVTCSIGISITGGPSDTYDALFDRADRALYSSKNQGKNQFTMSRERQS
ncbi:MAG: GGDEF domain-containing protein [Oscillibacter sp.]|jgi:diguanylate cyclase (GGDEF)-like protein|nr:GGDEF domain-containing protein [Oscillibacter sp.]